MVIVKNIKYTNIPFETKDKDFLRCIEYIKSVDSNYKKYLPKTNKQNLSFELTKANSALANTIRRFLLDEIPVLSMDVSEMNIISDDKFILTDYLKKNIEMIPINQDIDKSVKLQLNIENKTDEIISVYARDIEIYGKNGKKINNETYFTGTIPIINLRSMCSLKISDIGIVSGLGKHDSGKFILLSNIQYDILDMEPPTTNKFASQGKSSLVSNPEHFKISFTTHRNLNIKKIMGICCDTILSRLNIILKELTSLEGNTNVYFSEIITIETKGNIKLFHFIGEYWTISNLLSRYCYIVYPDIQFVCSCIVHPSVEESIVKIIHPQSIKILSDAIKKIISDVNTIKIAF